MRLGGDGNAVEEREIADLGGQQPNSVGDVLLDPGGGHAGRLLSLLAGLPNADRDDLVVAGVDQSVVHEAGLLDEGRQDALLSDAGQLVEAALGQVVGGESGVLHVLLLCPEAAKSIRSGFADGTPSFEGPEDQTIRSLAAVEAQCNTKRHVIYSRHICYVSV